MQGMSREKNRHGELITKGAGLGWPGKGAPPRQITLFDTPPNKICKYYNKTYTWKMI